jgi:hypothetical protein
VSYILRKIFRFVYPLGKPIPPHLLCCQGLAVGDYSFALGCLEAGAPSAFAQSGLYVYSKRITKNSENQHSNQKFFFNFYLYHGKKSYKLKGAK